MIQRMAKHYDQYCPVAHSLDVVGDRWALLVVRELMQGPKRYTDLAEGLPGIGTNILAARLRDLEAAGVVTKKTLPPPAASPASWRAPTTAFKICRSRTIRRATCSRAPITIPASRRASPTMPSTA